AFGADQALAVVAGRHFIDRRTDRLAGGIPARLFSIRIGPRHAVNLTSRPGPDKTRSAHVLFARAARPATKMAASKRLTNAVTLPPVPELGMEPRPPGRAMAIMKLPYQGRLAGNPEPGVIHGGAVTTLTDTVCGLAVIPAPDEPSRVATLDLRIDYLRPATP